jgi:hypothetical protein
MPCAWPLVAAGVVACVLAGAAPSPARAAAPDEGPVATLFRVFLKDGTPLVSYGEYARVGDRVVFTVPLGSAASPDSFQVVSLPLTQVDWERTSRYTDTVRYQRYAATRGDADYTALTAEVARALSELALNPDPARKLDIARRTRAMLIEWPRTHFGYRSREVRDLALVLDEAISEIRAQQGQNSFEFDLVAVIEPPPGEVLPVPSEREAMTAAVAAAKAADVPAERLSLQQSILAALSAPGRTTPPAWVPAMRKTVEAEQKKEVRLARAYTDLASRAAREATRLAAEGDVTGVNEVMAAALRRDTQLGGRRPDDMASLVAALEATLDAAKTRRLELDRWQYRLETHAAYRSKIESVLARLNRMAEDLGAIRAMAGPSHSRLGRLRGQLADSRVSMLPLDPPAELRDVHAGLLSALSLMEEAVRQREAAVAAADRALAGNASAAAAGAVLLFDRARAGIQAYFARPESP